MKEDRGVGTMLLKTKVVMRAAWDTESSHRIYVEDPVQTSEIDIITVSSSEETRASSGQSSDCHEDRKPEFPALVGFKCYSSFTQLIYFKFSPGLDKM